MRARAVSHVGLHTGESKMRGPAHQECASTHLEQRMRGLAPRTEHARPRSQTAHARSCTSNSECAASATAFTQARRHSHVTVDERSVGLPIGVLIIDSWKPEVGRCKLEEQQGEILLYCVVN